MDRPKCNYGGCEKLAERVGNGWRNYCAIHRKLKFDGKQRRQRTRVGNGRLKNPYSKSYCRKLIPAIKCSLCGWEGPCDRHRIKMGCEGGKYVEGNIIVLCPNCHRLVHLNKLVLK